MSRFNEYGLTPQQEIFAQKVVAGETQADAYREAYKARRMSEKTIHEEASRIASHHKVAARVRALQGAAAERAVLKGADVLREIKRIALSNIASLWDAENSRFKLPHELDADTSAAVASFEIDQNKVIKYRLWSKLDALEKAMKHLGLYERDNAQQTNPLRELLDSLGGAVVGVSSGKSRRAREQ